jgi:hypothetical protein
METAPKRIFVGVGSLFDENSISSGIWSPAIEKICPLQRKSVI